MIESLRSAPFATRNKTRAMQLQRQSSSMTKRLILLSFMTTLIAVFLSPSVVTLVSCQPILSNVNNLFQNSNTKSNVINETSRRHLTLFGGPRTYNVDDPVPLFVNKIGPYNNPSETYQYYDLPVCHPDEGVKDKLLSLGEVLAADRLVGE